MAVKPTLRVLVGIHVTVHIPRSTLPRIHGAPTAYPRRGVVARAFVVLIPLHSSGLSTRTDDVQQVDMLRSLLPNVGGAIKGGHVCLCALYSALLHERMPTR